MLKIDERLNNFFYHFRIESPKNKDAQNKSYWAILRPIDEYKVLEQDKHY